LSESNIVDITCLALQGSNCTCAWIDNDLFCVWSDEVGEECLLKWCNGLATGIQPSDSRFGSEISLSLAHLVLDFTKGSLVDVEPELDKLISLFNFDQLVFLVDGFIWEHGFSRSSF
jgi:hypothetical protein